MTISFPVMFQAQKKFATTQELAITFSFHFLFFVYLLVHISTDNYNTGHVEWLKQNIYIYKKSFVTLISNTHIYIYIYRKV